MLPNIPLISRRAVGSGGSGFLYDPYTLLLRVPQTLDEPKAQNDKDFARQAFGDHTGIVHESVHWLQFHGTTIGALLSLIKYSQERTAFNWLRKLDGTERKRVLGLRNDFSIVPVADRTGELNLTNSSGSHELQLLRQIWHDHTLTFKCFFNSVDQEATGWERREAIAEVIADAMLTGCATCKLGTYPGNKLARSFFRFGENEIGFVRVMGERLTTLLLMESHATAQEFINALGVVHAMDGTIFDESLLEGPFQKLLDSNYGLPLRAFLMSTGTPKSRIATSIPTLSAIIDIALNPPVPPLVLEFNAPAQWKDIYPPLRFCKLLTVVSKVGFVPLQCSHNQLRDYIGKLCDAAGLMNSNEYAHPFAKSPSYFDFGNASFDQDPKREARNIDYYLYLLWTQSRMWELRSSNLPFMVSSGESHTGGAVTKIVDYSLGKLGRRWFRPQIFWTANDDVGHGEPDGRAFGSWLVSSTAVHFAIYDLMYGLGPVDLSAYPPKLRTPETSQFLSNQVDAMINDKR